MKNYYSKKHRLQNYYIKWMKKDRWGLGLCENVIYHEGDTSGIFSLADHIGTLSSQQNIEIVTICPDFLNQAVWSTSFLN